MRGKKSLVPALSRFGAAKTKRIGLLGGSFNPAHEGHLYISLTALKYLGLDEVWWLVSPQNPLKSTKDMRPLAKRMASAKKMAGPYLGRQIHVMDLETKLGTRYSIDTISLIKQRNFKSLFIWLMGFDTFQELPLWKRHRDIVKTIPIAVFKRRVYNGSMKNMKLSFNRYIKNRTSFSTFQKLCFDHTLAAPAICMVPSRYYDLSATELRAKGEF